MNEGDDDDDDFISTKKPSKTIELPKKEPVVVQTDPVEECLEAITSEIEQNDATCPICNQPLTNFFTIDQRQQHVNQCLEESQIKNVRSSNHKISIH